MSNNIEFYNISPHHLILIGYYIEQSISRENSVFGATRRSLLPEEKNTCFPRWRHGASK